MLYINKQRPLKETVEELERVRKEAGWDEIDKTDTEKVRSAFDLVDKAVLRKSLIREQRGLCAYCMRKIQNDHHTSIEHLKPLELYGDLALDYSNLMACCDGGRAAELTGGPRILCCDASKGSKEITISPYNRGQMEKIRYGKDGKIHTFPADKMLDNDINNILNLNGKMGEDTVTSIVYGRRQVYNNYVRLVEGLSKRDKNLKAVLMRKRDEIRSAENYPEYAGVWLFFLNRKIGA